MQQLSGFAIRVIAVFSGCKLQMISNSSIILLLDVQPTT